MRFSSRSAVTRWAIFISGSAALALPAMPQHYKATGLTADQSGVATLTDTNLVNPWGMSRSSGSPWWISDNGTGLSTLYDGTGAAQSLVVTIPTGDPSASPTGTPTGTVFNFSTGFDLIPNTPTSKAAFLFVTEDGTVSGWTSASTPTSPKSRSTPKAPPSSKARPLPP